MSKPPKRATARRLSHVNFARAAHGLAKLSKSGALGEGPHTAPSLARKISAICDAEVSEQSVSGIVEAANTLHGADIEIVTREAVGGGNVLAAIKRQIEDVEKLAVEGLAELETVIAGHGRSLGEVADAQIALKREIELLRSDVSNLRSLAKVANGRA